MKYFSNLPLIIKAGSNNNSLVTTNLLSRSYILPSLLKNVVLFYEYDIKEGDSPENIAYRYYGDVYRYWLILYSNNIIDPQSEWPLNSNDFQRYIFYKYREDVANGLFIPVEQVQVGDVMSYVTSYTHHFEKILTISDSSSYQTQVIRVVIDADTYNSLFDYSEKSATFENGVVVKEVTTKAGPSLYDYELELNEKKRRINILNSNYAVDMEKQFVKLVRGI